MIDEKKIQEAAIMNADWIEKKRVAPRLKMALNGLRKLFGTTQAKCPKRERLSFSWQNRIVQSIIMLALCTTLWITIKTANGGA